MNEKQDLIDEQLIQSVWHVQHGIEKMHVNLFHDVSK